MDKGRNISSDMDQKLTVLETKYCIAEKKINEYIESHRNDFASTLKYCQVLYRMIDSLSDDQMRANVVKLDTFFHKGIFFVIVMEEEFLMESLKNSIQ